MAKLRLCQKERLAIVATADPTRGQAPYADDEFEIWALGVTMTYPDVKRVDLVFELHNDKYFEERDPNVLERLSKTEQPIYMLKKRKDIPTSMAYPMEMITTDFRRYHTSSITYMLVLALHSFLETGLPKQVNLYGVHMVGKEEYQDQRPCCEYWVGVMEGTGMVAVMPDGGSLLTGNGLYGVENYNPVCWDIRQRVYGLTAGVNHAVAQGHAAEIQRAKNEGAILEAEHWLLKFQRGEL